MIPRRVTFVVIRDLIVKLFVVLGSCLYNDIYFAKHLSNLSVVTFRAFILTFLSGSGLANFRNLDSR